LAAGATLPINSTDALKVGESSAGERCGVLRTPSAFVRVEVASRGVPWVAVIRAFPKRSGT
jgi:hypothetical protein